MSYQVSQASKLISSKKGRGRCYGQGLRRESKRVGYYKLVLQGSVPAIAPIAPGDGDASSSQSHAAARGENR